MLSMLLLAHFGEVMRLLAADKLCMTECGEINDNPDISVTNLLWLNLSLAHYLPTSSYVSTSLPAYLSGRGVYFTPTGRHIPGSFHFTEENLGKAHRQTTLNQGKSGLRFLNSMFPRRERRYR